MKQNTSFKRGDYIVLLSTISGQDDWKDMPINHIYRLAANSTRYWIAVEKGIEGRETQYFCSWSDKDKSKLNMRKAEAVEVDMYEMNNGPIKI